YEERRERYEDAKEHYVEARVRAKLSVEDFNAARFRLENSSDVNKAQLRQEVREKARLALLSQVESAISKLEAISENENAPADVNAAIEFFLEKKLALENEQITNSELVEISKDVHRFWAEWNIRLKKQVGRHLNEGINGIIGKAGAFSARIDAQINALSEQGKDTNVLVAGVAKLRADVADFNSLYEGLRVAYSEADSREDAKEILEQAHDALREMNKQLIDDFRLMKSIYKATREMEVSGEISAQTNMELELEIEDESELEGLEDELESSLDEEEDDVQ
ncbi:MAG: hypothetical protein NUV67_03885, partial [archaeon]|nr:hypothetical protein [archaeon]